jgi:glycosyltransferase involved in cell wall biosynthesis
MAKKMDAIITVSKNAADDIHKIYNIPLEKITIVYNTSQFNDLIKYESRKKIEILKNYNLPREYLLYVGIIAIKKNLDTVVKAIHLLKQSGIDFPKLVLVGPKYPESDASSVFSKVRELGLEDEIKYIGKIPKEDLFLIFKNAMIFLFPSVHEGFGIPCLEAMELGVPIIASKTSAIPEIVGNAGFLIEDYMSPKIWAEAIEEILQNSDKQKALIYKGKERAKLIRQRFSYESVIKLYESLLGN